MLDIKLYINMISMERGTDKRWGARGCREANLKERLEDFPGGAVVKNLPANAGDTGSIPVPGRSHMPWSN